MVADSINETAAVAALNKLQPAVLRAMENERKMARQGNATRRLTTSPRLGRTYKDQQMQGDESSPPRSKQPKSQQGVETGSSWRN
jgi:hypothetical protein